MKPKINKILPIVLATILPPLSLGTNSLLPIRENGKFYIAWISIAIILYILWYALLFIRDAKSKNQKAIYISGLILFLLVYWGLLHANVPAYQEEIQWNIIVRITIAILLFYVIQYALKAQENISTLRVDKEQIQTENYRTQLKALRNQVDPHFLFNSLNTLRSMVRQQHENAEKFIISLADFYRQTLKHNENTTLPLSEELLVLESYLFLMKNRNEEAMSVRIDIDPTVHAFHLPSMALQVVVENCFKHNSMTSKKPLYIEIESLDDHYIEVRNNRQAKLNPVESSGFGLDLLRKRYELMNVKNGIIIHQTPDQFSVQLKLI